MIDISGKWKLLCKVEQPEKEEFKDQEFVYYLDLTTEDGDITGKIFDISNDKLIEENIEGFIEDNVISFIWPLHSNHFLKNKINIDPMESEDLSDIEFTGEFNEENNEISGEWHLVLDVIQKGYFYFEEGFYGTWKMVKVTT